MHTSLLVTDSAASETRLTLPATVRTELDISLSDDALDQLIRSASAEITALIAPQANEDGDRAIGRETLTETFYNVANAFPLFLARRPVVSISQITNDGTAASPGGDDYDYVVRKSLGAIFETDDDDNLIALNADVFKVEYTAGWKMPGESGRNLPYEIERACILHVRDQLLRVRPDAIDGIVRREELEGIGTFEYETSRVSSRNGMSAEVMRLLQPYLAAPSY